MSDDTYCYPPNFTILKNKLGLPDQASLDRAERLLVTKRTQEPFPNGDFDLAHLCALHRHLFQDVYEWAGKLRTVEIAKGGSQFQFCRYIETGMKDVHRRIHTHDYLRGLDRGAFASLAGEVMGDVNYVHPFREGNGRTQLYYFKQLAEQAGFDVMLSRLPHNDWMEASRQAHLGDYVLMSTCLRRTLFDRSRTPPTRSRNRRR